MKKVVKVVLVVVAVLVGVPTSLVLIQKGFARWVTPSSTSTVTAPPAEPRLK